VNRVLRRIYEKDRENYIRKSFIICSFYPILLIAIIEVRFLAGLGIFLFDTTTRPALGPTQPPIQWAPGILSLGVKLPEREAEHSLPYSAEVNNACLHSHNTPSWRGSQLKKSTRDNFILLIQHY
jgi:hypothetical protein